MDLRSHKLLEFHSLTFHLEATEYSEAYDCKGLLVSILTWDHKSRPCVGHYVASKRNYRLFHTDEAVNLVLMKEDETKKVEACFDDSLSLEEYISNTTAALLKAAEDFEMALLEGNPFPQPEEIGGYDSYRVCITDGYGRSLRQL